MVELIGGSQQNELFLYCVSEVYVVSEESPLLVDSLCIYICIYIYVVVNF